MSDMVDPEVAARIARREAEEAREARMDQFVRRITVFVVTFVLTSVTIAAIPLLVLLYRSTFGQ